MSLTLEKLSLNFLRLSGSWDYISKEMCTLPSIDLRVSSVLGLVKSWIDASQQEAYTKFSGSGSATIFGFLPIWLHI